MDRGVLKEVLPLHLSDGKMGICGDPDGGVIGYAETPGYETYRGLGWFGLHRPKMICPFATYFDTFRHGVVGFGRREVYATGA